MVFIDRRTAMIENKYSMARMFADTPDELDEMAARLGLDLAWKFQGDTPVAHFLVTANKRMVAVRYGAILMSTDEVIDRLRRRERGENDPAAVEWEPVRLAFAEIAELTKTLESAVPSAGIVEAARPQAG